MPKIKYSEELKLEVVQYVLNGHSKAQASKKYLIDKGTVQKWVDAYNSSGSKG